eukprot:gene6435-biopygen17894
MRGGSLVSCMHTTITPSVVISPSVSSCFCIDFAKARSICAYAVAVCGGGGMYGGYCGVRGARGGFSYSWWNLTSDMVSAQPGAGPAWCVAVCVRTPNATASRNRSPLSFAFMMSFFRFFVLVFWNGIDLLWVRLEVCSVAPESSALLRFPTVNSLERRPENNGPCNCLMCDGQRPNVRRSTVNGQLQDHLGMADVSVAGKALWMTSHARCIPSSPATTQLFTELKSAAHLGLGPSADYRRGWERGGGGKCAQQSNTFPRCPIHLCSSPRLHAVCKVCATLFGPALAGARLHVKIHSVIQASLPG